MNVTSSLFRAAGSTALAAGLTFTAATFSKDAFFLSVDAQETFLQLRAAGALPGLYLNSLTNPALLGSIGEKQVMDLAQEKVQRWKSLQTSNQRAKCQEALGGMNKILGTLDTDGMKLIRLALSAKLDHAVLEDGLSKRPAAKAFDPVFMKTMDDVHDRAKAVILEDRSTEDYGPAKNGLMALAGMTLLFASYFRRGDEDEDFGLRDLLWLGGFITSLFEDRYEIRGPRSLLGLAGFVLAVGAGVCAVRDADGMRKNHAPLKPQVCAEALMMSGLK